MTAAFTALFGGRKDFNRMQYLAVSFVLLCHDVRITFSLKLWIGLSPSDISHICVMKIR